MTWEGGFSNPTVGPAQIQDESITSIKLASTLQSDNFVSGTSGWQLKRDTGDLEANDIVARGIIESSIFRTAASGERLEINGQTGETFIRLYNSSDALVGVIGLDATGFGLDEMVVSGPDNVILNAGAGIELTAAGSAGFGVIVTDPSPAGGIPGAPFAVVSGSGSGFLVHNSNSAATPTWAFYSDDDTGIYNDSGIKFAVGGTGFGWISTAGDWRIGHISDTGKAFIRGSTAQVATAPTYSFQGDLDTGMYWKTTNQLAFSTGGVLAMFIDHGQNMNMNGNILHTVLEARVDGGTSTNPSYTFNSDQDLGIYRKGTNDLGLTSAGTVAHWRGNTTTNSGLASWRHNSFGGGSVYEWLPLTSSGKYKTNIKPANPTQWLQRLDRLQPVTYKSKAGADDGRRRFLGIVKEDAEKVWPNWTYDAMTVPLLMAIQDLRERVKELEAAA